MFKPTSGNARAAKRRKIVQDDDSDDEFGGGSDLDDAMADEGMCHTPDSPHFV